MRLPIRLRVDQTSGQARRDKGRFAQVPGTEGSPAVTLRRGAEATMDAHPLPLMRSSDVGLVASP